MDDTDALTSKLQNENGIPGTLAACWVAFDFIQRTATVFAAPDTPLFHAFLSTVPAACEGRDLVGSAPSMPSETGAVPATLDHHTTSPEATADALAELAIVVMRKLTRAAEPPALEADQQAMLAATEAATEIVGLLKA